MASVHARLGPAYMNDRKDGDSTPGQDSSRHHRGNLFL